MSRIYFTDESGALSQEDIRHMTRVLRARVGDVFRLSDGAGNDYSCVVTSLSPFLYEQKAQLPPTLQRRRLTVLLAASKQDKLATTIRRLTELGAADIVIFKSANGDATLKNFDFKAERYRKIVIEAAKQCGRSTLCNIHFAKDFAAALGSAHGSVIFCHEKATVRLSQITVTDDVTVCIGPEGGFDDKELALAEQQGATAVLISQNVLRCETAAIAAAAMVMEM